MSATKPAALQIDDFDRQMQAVQDMLSGQVLVSQDRCVDGLLDLYNVAPTALLREMIGELISDIRFVTAVRAQLLGDDLTLLDGFMSPN
ncbi:MAG: hypothetical protein GY724_26665 [Actinomycetia bacterium]|nr:hypothetical protein [Actinomycetes bacterium]MCP4222466.1 hypothetical protein [Actinomycetes bacterium]MCP5032380.1 hypothetical protein [Actinomycetes bacterium]